MALVDLVASASTVGVKDDATAKAKQRSNCGTGAAKCCTQCAFWRHLLAFALTDESHSFFLLKSCRLRCFRLLWVASESLSDHGVLKSAAHES